MSDGASLQVDGVSDLMREFMQLPEVFQKRIMKGAVATGASVIRKEAIALAPVWTGPVSHGHPPAGTLKKAIYQTRLVEECTPTLEVWKVDVRRGKKQRNVGGNTSKFGPTRGTNLDAYYASWVEYGHYTRAPKGSAKAVRSGETLVTGSYFVLPRPFMRPAYEGKKNAALQAMQDYVTEQLPIAVIGMKYLQSKEA